MKITSSYHVELLRINKRLAPTIKIGRDSLAFCITHINEVWEMISAIQGRKERFNFVEKLFHTTKDNPQPKFDDFDQRFYKMP